MPDKTIANDLHLCIVNADTAARHMTENARVYRDRRGPGRRLWFRLAGDPRNDASTAEVAKEIKVYGGRPFAPNGAPK